MFIINTLANSIAESLKINLSNEIDVDEYMKII
jgi:hypothetical protein